MNFDKDLPVEKRRLFRDTLKEIRKESRFDVSENFIQHGTTTVKEHCIKVAYRAYYISHKFNIDVDEKQLIRGALLHDYFLYDWHEKSWANSIHGYTHPTIALREAEKEFRLSAVEKDMIKHHMFPFTPMPPKSVEGILLCMADKLCAMEETFYKNRFKKKVK